MRNPQDAIAVLYRIDQDTDRLQIINLFKILVLHIHFFINAVKILRAPFNFAVNVELLQLFLQCPDDFPDIGFPFPAFGSHLVHQIIVAPGINISQRNILKLPLDFENAEAVCQRSVNFKRFICFFPLLFLIHIFQRSQVMEPVCQLDDNHTDILCHGQEHFAQTLRLLLFLRFIGKPAQFGNAIHHIGDLVAEPLRQFLFGNTGILNGIMQQTCGNGIHIHAQIHQDVCDGKGMNAVWLAGRSFLPFMGFGSKFIDFPDLVDGFRSECLFNFC